MEKGGRDKEALIAHVAATQIAEYFTEREPKGQYDPKAMLQLEENKLVFMDRASREQVQTWRAYLAKNPLAGCNLGNIAYADTRLALWGEQKTVSGLEQWL